MIRSRSRCIGPRITRQSRIHPALLDKGCPKSTRQPPRYVSERQIVSKSVLTAAAMPVRRHTSRPRIKLEYSNRPSPAARHAVERRCIAARRARSSRLRRFRTWQTSAGRHSCIRVTFEDGGCRHHARAAARRSGHRHASQTVPSPRPAIGPRRRRPDRRTSFPPSCVRTPAQTRAGVARSLRLAPPSLTTDRFCAITS